MNEWSWKNGKFANEADLETETVAAGLVEITRDCETEEEALATMLETVFVAMEFWVALRFAVQLFHWS